MQPSPLQLEHLFYPVTNVSAYAVTPDKASMGAPELKATAYFRDDASKMFVNVKIDWGTAESMPYLIHILAHGSFAFPEEAGRSQDQLERLAIIASGAVVSASREHIASVTARGPHGEVFLPILSLTRSDVQINLDPGVAERIGIAKDKEAKPVKKTANPKA